jgi:uncharacterized protein
MGVSNYTACLLVDGYNIIGAWPSLKRVKQQDGFEQARRELIEVLTNYSARKSLETYVVFDAHFTRTPASQEVITDNLSVCFTDFGQTADTYIEKICSRLTSASKRNNRIIVATSDRAHQLTVVGYGAEWMSAQQLAGDVHLADRQGKRRSDKPNPLAHRSLFQGLDDEAREKLTRLRFGIR